MPLDLWMYLSPEQREQLLRLQQRRPAPQPSPLAPQPGPTQEAALLAGLTGGPPTASMAGPSGLAPQPAALAAPSATTWASPWGALPIPRGAGANIELLNALFRDTKPTDTKALSAELTDEERAEARRSGWAGVAAGAAQTPWNATPAQALANAFAGYAQGAHQGREDIRTHRKEGLALANQDLEARLKLAELFKIKAADTFGSAETGYYTLGADGKPVQLVAGVGPKPTGTSEAERIITTLATMSPDNPQRASLEARLRVLTTVRDPDHVAPSETQRLIEQLATMSPGDPRRGPLEARLKVLTTRDSGTQIVVNPDTHEVTSVDKDTGQTTVVKPGEPRRLAPGEIEMLKETEDTITQAESAIKGFERALALNPRVPQGWTGWVQSQWQRLDDPKAYADTQEFEKIIGGATLEQLKAIFGGNPTEGERKALIDLQASITDTAEARRRALENVIAKMRERLVRLRTRQQQLRTGEYGRADPEAGQAPAAGDTPAPKKLRYNPTTGELEPVS